MPNIRISLNQPTAKLVVNGATAIWVPFKEQPRFWNEHTRTFFYKSDRPIPPCQSGDTVHWLEPWDYHHPGSTEVIYKADMTNFVLEVCRKTFNWRSPVTMPNSACRHVWTVGKVEAVQVKSIGIPILFKLGLPIGATNKVEEAYEWFDTTYPHLSMDAWGWYIEKEK